jgi:hypothetical protein
VDPKKNCAGSDFRQLPAQRRVYFGLICVSFLAMVRKVKSGDFHFFTRSQPDNCLDEKSDDRCAYNRQHQGQSDGLELFQRQRLEE